MVPCTFDTFDGDFLELRDQYFTDSWLNDGWLVQPVGEGRIPKESTGFQIIGNEFKFLYLGDKKSSLIDSAKLRNEYLGFEKWTGEFGSDVSRLDVDNSSLICLTTTTSSFNRFIPFDLRFDDLIAFESVCSRF